MHTKHKSENIRAYGIELADGTVWQLNCDKKTSDWLAELAHIMELKPASQKPTRAIHFHGVKDLNSPFTENPPFINLAHETGWKAFKNGGIHRVWRHKDRPEIHVELHEGFLDHDEIRYINMWSALRELYRHALLRGGTPMHATLAALDGNGVLIAGAGGTGKSTCYSRLPDDWDRLCDDQALVLKIKENQFRVHPFPTWSDYLWRESKKQWHVERSVPLKALFFLEQAPRNVALPLTDPSEVLLKYLEAAKQVWQPIWSRAEQEEKGAESALLFDNVTQMAHTVPAYRLQATLNGSFWKEMEKVCFQD